MCVMGEERTERREETLLSCTQSILQICHSSKLSSFWSRGVEECEEVYRRECRVVLSRQQTDQTLDTCSTPLSQCEEPDKRCGEVLQRSCTTR